MSFCRHAIISFLILFFLACSPDSVGTSADGRADYSALGPIVMSHLPARESDTISGWGLVGENGRMLFSDKFSTPPSAAVSGYFSVKEGSGVTVYYADSVPKPVDGLVGLESAGVMAYGLMPVVRQGKRIELVDAQGISRITLSAFDGREIVKTAPYFVDNLLAVCMQDGLWGAVDTQGTLIIEPVYVNEPRFSEKVAVVAKGVEERIDSVTIVTKLRHYIINNKGKVIFTFPEGTSPIGEMRGRRMPVRLASGRIAMLYIDGKVTELPDFARSVEGYDSDYVVISTAPSHKGLLGPGMVTLINPDYATLQILGDDRFLVSDRRNGFAITDSIGQAKTMLPGLERIIALNSPARGIVSPFSLLGDNSAGKVLLTQSGHRLGNGPFPDILIRPHLLTDEYIHTGFFNCQAVVHAVAKNISENGWKDVVIGGRMPSVPDSVRIKAPLTMSLHLGREQSYMLTLDAVVYSDKPVLSDSVNAAGERFVFQNPEATVKYVRAEAAVPGARYDEMLHHLREELVPVGFKAESIKDEYVVYRRNDRFVIVTPRPGLEGMYVYIMDSPFYKAKGEIIISDGVAVYKRGVTKESEH